VRETAERAARGLDTELNNFIYQQVWRGRNVERLSVVAAEAGRTPMRLFAYLCRNDGRPGRSR
jgi:hypothetical protein